MFNRPEVERSVDNQGEGGSHCKANRQGKGRGSRKVLLNEKGTARA